MPNFSGRSRGMPSAASLVQTPWMSGSPQAVFGADLAGSAYFIDSGFAGAAAAGFGDAAAV